MLGMFYIMKLDFTPVELIIAYNIHLLALY